MALGDRIKMRREELALTRIQLADRLGVTPSTVSNYETGVSFPKEEVMLRLWKNTSGFEGDAHQRHWLVRVTINVCKDLSRAPWRLHSVPLAQAPPQPCADEPEAQAVVEEILRLPKKYRVPLYLYHYEGYSVREISALLKANPSTIRTRLSRARELLKHQLEEG